MKFVVFLVLSCLCIYGANAEKVTNWGKVLGRDMGSEYVVVSSSILEVITFDLTFPKV